MNYSDNLVLQSVYNGCLSLVDKIIKWDIEDLIFFEKYNESEFKFYPNDVPDRGLVMTVSIEDNYVKMIVGLHRTYKKRGQIITNGRETKKAVAHIVLTFKLMQNGAFFWSIPFNVINSWEDEVL